MGLIKRKRQRWRVIEYKNIQAVIKAMSDSLVETQIEKINIVEVAIAVMYISKSIMKSIEITGDLTGDQIKIIEKHVEECVITNEFKEIVEKNFKGEQK